MALETLKGGVVRRREKRSLGLFIDGTGLDRATRRLNRKVDMASLVRGVTSGLAPTVARYYTLIPYEDDSRHRAFLDAVTRAGLTVVVKRLPPKGVNRQVSVDLEMAADMVAFAQGFTKFGSTNLYHPHEEPRQSDERAARGSSLPGGLSLRRRRAGPATSEEEAQPEAPETTSADGATEAASEKKDSEERTENRIITVVCPSRELAYPIQLAREMHVDTVSADFGQFNAGDVLKSAAKWIDLSDSETIWRD